jgi:branched-chain amino acid transport system ATP-binding protein
MIHKIAGTGISIIVIEHLMRVVASLAQRVIVLHRGAILSQGTTAEVFEDANVIEAYLGSRFAQKA